MTIKLSTLPPSTNHIYGRGGSGVFLLPKVREAKEEIAWEARTQYRGEPMKGDLKVSVAIYWPDKRKHDVDNIKVLLDACTEILWEDDGQIIDLRVRKFYDKADPRVEMEVLAV